MKRHGQAASEYPELLADLIERVARRDQQAFAELYALTKSKMRKTALAAGTRNSDIDDILQDAYMKVWRNAARFDRGRASAITWMSTITRNTAVDAFRARKPPAAELSEALAVPAPLESAGRDGLDLARAEPIALNALARLPEDRRRLLTLAYIAGESRANLSQRFGAPVGTIKTWLHRTLATVRQECLLELEQFAVEPMR